MERTCEVWAVGRSQSLRILDLMWYGHATHICERQRQFGSEHDGYHECICGMQWPKQSTDNN